MLAALGELAKDGEGSGWKLEGLDRGDAGAGDAIAVSRQRRTSAESSTLPSWRSSSSSSVGCTYGPWVWSP